MLALSLPSKNSNSAATVLQSLFRYEAISNARKTQQLLTSMGLVVALDDY
jgi:hypothetical protein